MGANIWRGIKQYPVPLIGAYSDGRLCSGCCFDCAAAYALAVVTIAVPLRKASASGRAEYMYFHGMDFESKRAAPVRFDAAEGELTVRKVHGNFETNAQIFKSGFGPHKGFLQKVLV